jgi:MFS family permease
VLADAGRSSRAAFAGIFAVTLLALLGIGAVLPVIPHYVRERLGDGDVAVGVAIGAFALTALACRPIAGSIVDRRGRRPVVVAGSAPARGRCSRPEPRGSSTSLPRGGEAA